MEIPLEWVNLLSNVGFPVLLVFYLLVRIEKSFEQLEDAIENLLNEINRKTP
ncbi:YvrJ family protein [Domibacillus enclensis]|uniref:YvrJ protein family protein n=1 Tax=Domibacillus enclensis TaxID=1017273 RepID=A0A1N7D0Y8_9BACI|nr:YvrJ family protein [Domibacillus enclensis]OXS72960.1 hypothetical protein B1B05_18965 [Domibacillus enclensis]SIR69546.1 YvrJ protein family protein [Domibacillus enclensis]